MWAPAISIKCRYGMHFDLALIPIQHLGTPIARLYGLLPCIPHANRDEHSRGIERETNQEKEQEGYCPYNVREDPPGRSDEGSDVARLVFHTAPQRGRFSWRGRLLLRLLLRLLWHAQLRVRPHRDALPCQPLSQPCTHSWIWQSASALHASLHA